MAIVDELFYRVGFEVDQASFSKVNGSLKSLAGVAAGIAAASLAVGAAIGGVAMNFVESAAKIEDAEAAFTPLLGGAEKAKIAIAELNKLGAQTPFEFADLAAVTKQLLPVMNGDINNTIDTIKLLGDTAGGNAQKLDTITRGYTKAMLKGKVDMESLNMIGEAGVPIIDQMAKMLGKSSAELYKMSTAGEITTKMLTDTFRKMTAEGGLFFNGMSIASATFHGRLSTLGDAIEMTKAAIGEQLLPIAKELVDKLIVLAEATQDWVNANKDMIASGFLGFMTAVKYAMYGAAFATGLWLLSQIGLAVMAIPATITAIIGMIGRISLYNIVVGLATAATWLWNAAVGFIPAIIGLCAVMLVLFFQDVYTYFKGGESVIGHFIDKMAEMFPVLGKIKTWFADVWSSAIGWIDKIKEKFMAMISYLKNIPFFKNMFGSATINAPTAPISGGAGVGPLANAATTNNQDIKIDVHGVSDPMDAAQMTAKALKQETQLAQQNYPGFTR